MSQERLHPHYGVHYLKYITNSCRHVGKCFIKMLFGKIPQKSQEHMQSFFCQIQAWSVIKYRTPFQFFSCKLYDFFKKKKIMNTFGWLLLNIAITFNVATCLFLFLVILATIFSPSPPKIRKIVKNSPLGFFVTWNRKVLTQIRCVILY